MNLETGTVSQPKVDLTNVPKRAEGEQYRDLIPGTNVGELIKALTFQKSFDDADILDGVSVAGGVRDPESGWIGKTKYSVAPVGGQELDTNDGSYEDWLVAQQSRIANQAAINQANERASYDDQISNLDKLLGFAATKKQQGIQSIEDQYNQTKGQQEQVFNKQRLQNTQNQEKGYNEVGTFANTSNNNLQRLLQGANAGRSSVGQVLAPYMVGRSADTRRKAVTDTAGENAANIDTTATTTFQDLLNQKKKNLNDYESSIGNTQQDLEQQKIDATRARDMANGATYAQTIANTHGLTANMDNRRNQLAALFDKYKPDYSVAKAPELSTYQVDPAQIKANQNNPSGSDFYLNQLKRKKELGL